MRRWQAQLVLHCRTALENECAATGQDSDFPRKNLPSSPVKKNGGKSARRGGVRPTRRPIARFFAPRPPDRVRASI